MGSQSSRQRRFVARSALKRCVRVLNQALVDLPNNEETLREKLRRVIRVAAKELKEDEPEGS